MLMDPNARLVPAAFGVLQPMERPLGEDIRPRAGARQFHNRAGRSQRDFAGAFDLFSNCPVQRCFAEP